MRWVWINIHQVENKVIVEKWNERNISMIVDILAKSKMKWGEMDIDENDNSRRVIDMSWVSGEGSLVGIVGNAYKFFSIFVVKTWNWSYVRPRWLLDEDNIKWGICFENSVDDEIVLVNVLRKDMNVL